MDDSDEVDNLGVWEDDKLANWKFEAFEACRWILVKLKLEV